MSIYLQLKAKFKYQRQHLDVILRYKLIEYRDFPKFNYRWSSLSQKVRNKGALETLSPPTAAYCVALPATITKKALKRTAKRMDETGKKARILENAINSITQRNRNRSIFHSVEQLAKSVTFYHPEFTILNGISQFDFEQINKTELNKK
ncbi:unnamed protein product [Dracunculus medinensis]|uniref:Transposase n=1 Tax=Dracunculus medinensis TaxID=318479 RepID=A0A0N4UFK1_DRAME|nr:unnamed protein product [Dracunculus medinensis]